ncbi:MAG: T9SS C-terminal target domain-containing protein [Balneola sp.]|nr:MAG: T9SS C-terminal target domain-containing protein [Balneola sp.]
MKFRILLCSLSLLSGAAFAQNLNVVSTSPADGDFDVDTDSVVITFDQKIDYSFFGISDGSTDSEFNFFIAPDDSVYYLGASISADSMSAVYYVELGENTDFTVYLLDGESADGDLLEDPYIFQFTTAADTGQFVIEGTIDQEALAKVIEAHPYEDIFVALAYDPIVFGEEDDSTDVRAVFSTLVDKETGDFSIPRVREGEYYPMAFPIFGQEEEVDFFPLFYFYDVDGDFELDAIQVDAGTTVNDTLSGVNLFKFEITPFTFQEAIEKADSTIADLENIISILGGNTFYASYSDDIEEDGTTEKTKFGSLGIERSFEADDHGGDGEFLDITSFPSGYQFQWSIFGYDAIKDSVVNIIVTPFDSFVAAYFGKDDTDLPDSVDFDSFDPLPVTFIDSDSAAFIMEENGGWEFRDRFTGNHSSWEMELEAFHNYVEFEPDPTTDAPVMWIGRYNGNTYNPYTGFAEQGYFDIYLDIETGEVLHIDSLIGEPFELALITFDEALALAEETIDSLGTDVVIVGGGTSYRSDFIFDSPQDGEIQAKGNPETPLLAADHDEEGGDGDWFYYRYLYFGEDEPETGEQLFWNIYGYNTVKDSAFSIGVTFNDVNFSGYLGKDETDLPDTVDFASIKPLPETFIDSDSAAYIIETNGGWDFRDRFHGDYSFWEMELEALHNYWEFGPNPTETAPVMWRGRYYGTSFDPYDGFYIESYLDIYIDIETGALLFTDSLTVNPLDSALITFSEALDLAQSVIDSLENDPVILGGTTFYFSETAFDGGTGGGDFKTVPEGIFTSNDGHDGEDDDDVFPFEFLFEPSGEQLQWEIFGYDGVKDSAFTISVSFFDTQFEGYISEEDAELPDTVAFSSLKEIPESFIDSDSAVYIMEENGGWDFRSEFDGDYGFWYMDLQAVHEYWLFPPDPTVDAPVLWKGSYLGLGFDPITEEYYGGYFVIYLDMETGEILFTDSEIVAGPGDSFITFDDAVGLADSLLSNHPNDLELVGGVTRYTNAEAIFKDNPNFQNERFQSKVTALADEDSSFTISPDGYAFSWELFAYDPVKDSVLFINVTEFDVFEMYYAGEDDFEEPIEFDDIDPLPFTHIDSDSAAYLIDEAGGYAFRATLEDSEINWIWEAELQLLHNYWEFPPDPTPDAPITWHMRYYAWAFDPSGVPVGADSLTIILDAETGDVLYQSVIVSNENEDALPTEFSLSQNYPNPFNPTTTIPFSLREASRVEISVYSILGQKVATIVNEQYPAGSHSVRWDARNLASGMYIYRMQAKGFTQTKKLILLK